MAPGAITAPSLHHRPRPPLWPPHHHHSPTVALRAHQPRRVVAGDTRSRAPSTLTPLVMQPGPAPPTAGLQQLWPFFLHKISRFLPMKQNSQRCPPQRGTGENSP